MDSIAIIGIGNSYRGDDGVGWLIINSLKKKLPPCITLYKIRGEMGEIFDLLSQYDIIFIADACEGPEPVGSWKRLEPLFDPLPDQPSQSSSHGFGVYEALSLAKVMQQTPKKVILYAIFGDSYSMSDKISPLVAGAAEEVTAQLIQEPEIQSCMKNISWTI